MEQNLEISKVSLSQAYLEQVFISSRIIYSICYYAAVLKTEENLLRK